VEKVVTYPDHVMNGIKKNHRAHPLPANLRLFGADTETVHGQPHTVQIWEGSVESPPWLAYVDKKTIFPVFWWWIRPRIREGGVNVCYFHNLHFDMMILFADHHLDMYEQGGSTEFFLEVDAVKLKKPLSADPLRRCLKVEILFGKVNAATVTEGCHYMEDGALRFEGRASLKILDSKAFTQTSLSRSLKMFQIPEVKLEPPKGLGSEPLKTTEFETYAKQDVVAEWHLGRKIMDLHAKYEVRPSISLPQFMSRVFRHDFFHPTDNIVFPPLDVVRAAEYSYHGGKNGIYCDPGVYEDVTEVDINSAYPWAMRELPSFLDGTYSPVDAWAGPQFVGVYKISGETDPEAKYPLVFDHKFKRIDGKFTDVWHTSYEVEKMLSCGFVKLSKISGFIWNPGGIERNPFRDFVDHFYELKQNTPHEDPYYNFYKIALNSLYGKLVGVIEDRELMELQEGEDSATMKLDYRWDSALDRYVHTKTENVAGAMYNPFIASLITGRVRALLFDLETKYQALHSATDSIKTLMRPKANPGLGGWKEECHGRCWIFRNKLYLHFDERAAKNPARGITDGGQGLVKYALHAYKGSVEDLYKNRRKLLREGKMEYEFTHVVGLREGLRRKETPGDFVRRKETLQLKRGK
jgi:hypothetical protein